MKTERLFMRGYVCCLFFLSITLFSHVSAQEIKVRSGFIPDSVVIGDQADYYLTATYPKKLTLLFPDSVFSFQPFEFQKKKYFTTQTTDSLSYDSAVYTLSTFEVDKIQYLQLPVFVLHQKDCTAILAFRDSVILKELVTQVLPDTLSAENLPLKINTAYHPVSWLFNYPLFIYVAIGLLIAVLLVWVFFRKRIQKYFKLKRLQKEHLLFITIFNEKAEQLKVSFSSQQTEHIVSHWKKYMEALDSKPYTKLTTRETVNLLRNQELGTSLRMMDGAIYGNQSVVAEPLENLRSHAIKSFQQKLEHVQHG